MAPHVLSCALMLSDEHADDMYAKKYGLLLDRNKSTHHRRYSVINAGKT